MRSAVVVLIVGACGIAPADDGPGYVPTSENVAREVEGWTVRVNRRLLDEEKALGGRALALLGEKLREVERAVPEGAVARLREVPIWLGVDDGHAPCAEYHPSREWLMENGYNPDKAKGVEIGCAARFVEWTPTQPSMILHELAHAYHDRVLGFDDAEVAAAYARAKASGRYDKVKHAGGGEERHYALTDAKEFFAEMTESALGRNDFFPFDRAELDGYDPETLEVVRAKWGLEGP